MQPSHLRMTRQRHFRLPLTQRKPAKAPCSEAYGRTFPLPDQITGSKMFSCCVVCFWPTFVIPEFLAGTTSQVSCGLLFPHACLRLVTTCSMRYLTHPLT